MKKLFLVSLILGLVVLNGCGEKTYTEAEVKAMLAEVQAEKEETVEVQQVEEAEVEEVKEEVVEVVKSEGETYAESIQPSAYGYSDVFEIKEPEIAESTVTLPNGNTCETIMV